MGSSGSETADLDLADLTVERDDAAAIEGVIGLDGGELTASAADGTTYRLTVPAGALPGDTTIRAVPATVADVDLPSWLVMFEPSGLQFYEDARLEITPAADVPVDEQFLFAISDDASSVGSALVDVTASTPTILVQHFSGYGLAQVASPERAAALLDRAATAEDRISARVGEALGRERQAQLLGVESEFPLDALTSAFEEYERDVIAPRLEAAGSSCAALKLALQTVLGYERQRQLLGIDEPSNVDTAGILEQALADGGPCEKEAIDQCKAAKDPSILIGFWLGRERQRQLLGMESSTTLDDLVERAKKICSPGYTASGGGNGLTVTGTVASLTEPFTLDGSFTGGTATFSYTPSSETAGSYSVAGSGSGATLSGSGTYTIADAGDGVLTMTQTTSACVDVSGQCNTSTEVITLTPS